MRSSSAPARQGPKEEEEAEAQTLSHLRTPTGDTRSLRRGRRRRRARRTTVTCFPIWKLILPLSGIHTITYKYLDGATNISKGTNYIYFWSSSDCSDSSLRKYCDIELFVNIESFNLQRIKVVLRKLASFEYPLDSLCSSFWELLCPPSTISMSGVPFNHVRIMRIYL